MKNYWLQTIIAAVIIFGATGAIFLYTSGYRLNKTKGEQNEINITQTGMINVKSVPDGANVYLNGELKTATNGTISGLEPKKYDLRIIKNGFTVWNKTIEVFPELVTDITAILVSQSPRLEPLTNSGARSLVISPSLNKLAFFSKNSSTPGVWVIPLTGDALNLFRSNPYVVLEDGPNQFYSSGKSIRWSPDENELLVENQNGDYYLVDLENGNANFIPNSDKIRREWDEELVKKRIDFIENLSIPNDLKPIATSPDTLWAPDGKKFLYICTKGVVNKTRLQELGIKNSQACEQNNNSNEGYLEYHVYNMEKPIPVGEKVETTVFTTKASEPQPNVSWYEDSFHLILAEKNPSENKGKISLIRIDGTNKIEVYNNTLYSNKVFSSPGGEKLIFLTSFKSGDQTDLYTVSIR